MDERRRAATYTRASLDKTGEGAAVSRQAEDCDRLAELRGFTVVARRRDNNRSAAGKKNRPGFEALLEDIAERRVDVVIAWSLDRLTRNRRDQLRLIETCEKAEVLIALVRGSDIDMSTPAGRLVADVLSGVARHEIDQKGDRQKRAEEQRAANGLPTPGGRRAFGYAQDGMTVIDHEAALIAAAADDILAGASLKGIAARWNAAGVTTTACRLGKPHSDHDCVGGPWRHDNVRSVLMNPRYAALRTRRGEVVGPAIWPPIITRETHEALRALLTMPDRRTTEGGTARKYLLPGLARCGLCPSDVATGHTQHGKRVYVCRAKKHVSRKADPVDALIAGGVIEGTETPGIVVTRLAQPDAVDLLETPTPDSLVVDRAKARTLNERLDELTLALEEGILPLTSVRESSARVKAELAAVQQRIDAVQEADALSPLIAAAENLEGTEERIAAVAAKWKTYDLQQQREVIDTLMVITLTRPLRGRQRFDPETVRIEWKKPA